MRVYYLARFRADPEKVRLSVRSCGTSRNVKWRVSLEQRGLLEAPIIVRYSCNPKRAVNKVLTEARALNVPGIDLEMAWTYVHPHGESAPHATRHEIEDETEDETEYEIVWSTDGACS